MIKLLTILLFAFQTAQTTPKPFTPGTYAIGDEVTHKGKVYVQVKGCKACKADPDNNSYWKEKAGDKPNKPDTIRGKVIVIIADTIIFKQA